MRKHRPMPAWTTNRMSIIHPLNTTHTYKWLLRVPFSYHRQLRPGPSPGGSTFQPLLTGARWEDALLAVVKGSPVTSRSTGRLLLIWMQNRRRVEPSASCLPTKSWKGFFSVLCTAGNFTYLLSLQTHNSCHKRIVSSKFCSNNDFLPVHCALNNHGDYL